ncbi:alpha/beta hydrolase family protein [Laspinema olomoucense]|uniref:alpha/beta hydrolase family protein n=1 Tax=Laspinema olomoucense TaxID=3231600 RepID=UPI0021BB6113|nr:chlorophyllase [Laspinema sp. D3d]MCT7971214.1 chlorophyllase [Laspinema sp. D3d]
MTLISSSSWAAIVAGFLAFCSSIPVAATIPEPMFDTLNHFETTIPRANGEKDPADIYYPVVPDAVSLPLALFLPGALVDKADYSNFAQTVASYGFVVVIPNRVRTVTISGQQFSGLAAEVAQVNEVLAYLEAEQSRSDSPLAGRVDLSSVGLLGHSWGGAVGLAAIQNICPPLLCTGSFKRPDAIKAGLFYGTTFRDQTQQEVTILPIANQGIPVGLIAGSRDGVIQGGMDSVFASYENIQDPPKALVTVLGANHYGITNEDSPRDSVRPTLAPAVANETIARWSALFLRAHLLEDEAAWNSIYQNGDALDANVTVKSETLP